MGLTGKHGRRRCAAGIAPQEYRVGTLRFWHVFSMRDTIRKGRLIWPGLEMRRALL
jgi:hypothetical protein